MGSADHVRGAKEMVSSHTSPIYLTPFSGGRVLLVTHCSNVCPSLETSHIVKETPHVAVGGGTSAYGPQSICGRFITVKAVPFMSFRTFGGLA